METISEDEAIRSFAPPTSKQKQDYGCLLAGFGGLEVVADRLWEDIRTANLWEDYPEIQKALPAWAPCTELESLSYEALKNAPGAYGNRLAGMRSVWVASDPEVARFRAELIEKRPPRPCELVVEQLRSLGQVEQVDNVVLLDGIPVPVGAEQIAFFVRLRWRWLAVPQQMLPADSGIQMADGSMKYLFAYSTDTHCQNLVKLQRLDLALFWAVWTRNFEDLESIANRIGGEALSKCLVAPDPRFGRLKDPVCRLTYGTALMSEFERVFEICECLHRSRAVTKEGIMNLLKNSSSMADIHASQSAVSAYLAGATAHTRFSHPTMNEYAHKKSSDRVLKQLYSAVRSTKSFWSDPTRRRIPFDGKPALYFVGIEQQFIPLAAIIMLVRNMKRLEGNYLHRAARGSSPVRRTENEAVRLAAFVAANVHIRWARALLGDRCTTLPDEQWVAAGMPATLEGVGPDNEVGMRNHADLYAAVAKRISKLPDVPKPGWTRCFYFEAWVRPAAEHSFIRKSCSWTRFSKKARNAHLSRTSKTIAATTRTGLPSIHPVEAAHARMRPLIERLQPPGKIARRLRKPYRRQLEIFVAHVARLFPAVTPITLDPYLNEQLMFSISDDLVNFAVEGAWETLRHQQ